MTGISPVRRGKAVNTETGELVQLSFFEDETVQRTRVRYDWTPYPGRHVNVPKVLLAKLYAKDSGYTKNHRDLFFFYLAHSPDGAEPLRLTYKEISEILGGRPATISTLLGTLHMGGLLLVAERVGRMKFYRVNPRAGFDGSAANQVEAVRDARLPVVPAPAAPAQKKKEAS
ncbi:helix-turn-helix transcriptional regulator [Streptomyces globisporus]|uniref:Helix-turn-helix transcriptional regulator n=1 Tax=Streptomyces globisporus TaxID=1908 RepID=A0A927BNL0_STRGL|nr:helix-turn-helix transcriptional regulator [Streptomyces globisporus]